MKITLKEYNIDLSFNFNLYIKKLRLIENLYNSDLKPIDTKHRFKVLKFFKKHNIFYSFTSEIIETAYKPERGFLFPNDINTMNLIHELCHYIVSERKDLNNFGLGAGFYDYNCDESFFEYPDCLDEEHSVLFLEFILARCLFKIPLTYIYYSMDYSSCDCSFLTEAEMILSDLNSNNFIKITK